uniref:Reverse transcriptase n=1 Tax=Chenopodium quinoa TaxID=63459 RepID=A0A803MXV6_CHEQI
MFKLARKAQRAKLEIKKWLLDKREEWRGKWDQFEKDLLEVQLILENEGDDEDFKQLRKKFKEYSKNMTIYWRQRAKINWNYSGDTCSRYFFNFVKGRRARNKLEALKDDKGDWVAEEKEIAGIATKHFRDIYRGGEDDSAANRIGDIESDIKGHELLEHIRTTKKGVKGKLALKTDMSKAYDRIKWDFLEEVLINFGVPNLMVFCPKYGIDNSKLFEDNWENRNSGSRGWKGVKWGLQVLKQGCMWSLGDGCKARIHHPWVKGKTPEWKNQSSTTTDYVSRLKKVNGEWDLELCRMWFSDNTTMQIQHTTHLEAGNDDDVVWKGNRAGVYTILETILEICWYSKAKNLLVENYERSFACGE